MEYTIYCDESRHDHSEENRYMVIGSLWVPRFRKADLTREFRAVREAVGLKGEIKWSKVSQKKLNAYRRLADFFFDQQDLVFRGVVVDQWRVGARTSQDRELGFYQFYFQMLRKWIGAGDRYLVLVDFKKNKGADRYTTLRRLLENRTKGTAWIDDLTVINSYESPLAQLCDFLTGAAAAAWCGFRADTAKARLASYIESR